MNEFSPESFERELRRHQPATPPPDLMARLIAADPKLVARPAPSPAIALHVWRLMRWWLTPATAVLLVALLVGRAHRPPEPVSLPIPTPARVPAVKLDTVNIESELINTFDTVARLPSGEAVRFRCREWVDGVQLRDRSRGVLVEKRSPRVEVVPVRFESY